MLVYKKSYRVSQGAVNVLFGTDGGGPDVALLLTHTEEI